MNVDLDAAPVESLRDATPGIVGVQDREVGGKGAAIRRPVLTWTEFEDLRGRRTEEHAHGWPSLVGYLREAGPFRAKEAAPLLKLARFGNAASTKGSLRHDANVLEVHGIEGDYDGGEVTMQEALRLLESANVRAALYPTASSRPDRPRWRVLCPLSRPARPDARRQLVARLNAVLGGILAPESSTLSQAYYFGRVAGSSDSYVVTSTFDDPEEGTCIDQLEELDQLVGSASTEEAQKNSEVIFCSLPSSSVEPRRFVIPASTIPAAERERNARLFELARHVKASLPNASRDELRAIAEAWHELALPHIETKEFAVTLEDFVRGYERVRTPHGSVMQGALAGVEDAPMPAGTETLGYGAAGNLLVRVCAALQKHQGADPFFLGARKAGELAGVDATVANKILRTLVADGVIELVTLGKGMKASRYRFTWGATA